MSFYRSDPVNFYRLVIPRESAWDIMNRLGTSQQIQVSNPCFISFLLKQQSSPDHFYLMSDAAKMDSIALDRLRKSYKIRVFTTDEMITQMPLIMKSSDCGMSNTPRAVDIQLASLMIS